MLRDLDDPDDDPATPSSLLPIPSAIRAVYLHNSPLLLVGRVGERELSRSLGGL